MPLILKIAKHSSQNCPLNNDATKQLNQQTMSQLPELTKKHGIKVVGAWTVVNEHLLVMVYETPSFEAFQKFLMEPALMKWIASQETAEYKVAMTAEESMKLVP